MIKVIASRMPILGMPGRPTGLFVRFKHLNEEQALANHGQTLTHLADRGGLSASEMLAIIDKVRFWDNRLDEDASLAELQNRGVLEQ
jgi:hypothetical protein